MNHEMVESQFVNPGSKRLPEAELQLRQDLEDGSADPSMQARIISQRTGNLWTAEQMQHLSDKQREHIDKLGPDASTAEKLVESFKSR